jgi:hypothetical protein
VAEDATIAHRPTLSSNTVAIDRPEVTDLSDLSENMAERSAQGTTPAEDHRDPSRQLCPTVL